MGNFISMLNIQSVLFIYLAVGAFARKKNIIHEKSQQSFVDFIIKITLPCMIFNSFDQAFTFEKMQRASLTLAFSFGISLVSFLLGKILFNRFPFEKKSILEYGTLVSNAGFAGLPLIASSYGNEALFYASIFMIPTRIFMWSAGISLFTAASFKTKAKNVMLNPGIIAVELGLVKMLFQIPVHPVLQSAIRHIGDCTSAMSMIVVGTILAEVDFCGVLEKGVLYLSFVRLIVLPFILLAALRLVTPDATVVASSVLLTGMPVGATTAILAQKYGADYKFASKCVFVSTLLSLITVPVLAIFL